MMMKTNHEQQIAALSSSDPVECNAAWEKFMETVIPKIEKRIEFRLRSTPKHVQQRIDDIQGKVMAKLVEKVRKGNVESNVTGLALAIADNYCMKAKETRRDGPLTIGSAISAQEDSETQSHINSQREERKNLRKKLRDFREKVFSEARLQRPDSDAKAPILQFLALDLIANGTEKPAVLIKITGLPDYTVSNLRKASFQRIAQHLFTLVGSSLPAEPSDFEKKTLEPGGSLGDLWFEMSMGCVQLDGILDNAHSSHARDIEHLNSAHEAECPSCQRADEFASAEKIACWINAAGESLPPR